MNDLWLLARDGAPEENWGVVLDNFDPRIVGGMTTFTEQAAARRASSITPETSASNRAYPVGATWSDVFLHLFAIAGITLHRDSLVQPPDHRL